MLGFSLWKSPYNFVGNESLDSMGKEKRKALFKIIQTESFVGHLRVGQVTKWLAKYSLAKDYSVSSMCFSRDLSRVVHSWVSHKRQTSLCSQFFTKFSHSTLTLNPTNIQGIDWQNTIKFDTELKPTKHNWKSLFELEWKTNIYIKKFIFTMQFS